MNKIAGFNQASQPSNAPIEPRLKDIEQEIEVLNLAAKTNQSLVSELTLRLQSVIAPFPRAEDNGKEAPETTISPLAQQIRQHRHTLEASNGAIQELLRVIEL